MEAPSLSPPAACLVFAGSSEQDVALAKSFWNSVTLQPQLESCLCSNGSGGALGQRRSHLDSQKNGIIASQPSVSERREDNCSQEVLGAEKADQKACYLQKAKKRVEIIGLLRKQRDERIMKEVVSQLFKPKTKSQESKVTIKESTIEEQESVKALS